MCKEYEAIKVIKVSAGSQNYFITRPWTTHNVSWQQAFSNFQATRKLIGKLGYISGHNQKKHLIHSETLVIFVGIENANHFIKLISIHYFIMPLSTFYSCLHSTHHNIWWTKDHKYIIFSLAKLCWSNFSCSLFSWCPGHLEYYFGLHRLSFNLIDKWHLCHLLFLLLLQFIRRNQIIFSS